MQPLIDLKTQYLNIEEKVKEEIMKVLDSGQFIMGDTVSQLENYLANYVGVKHCISCSSGTDALVMSLLANGVGPGDAVIVPSFTFIASAEAVSLTGAVPLFIDIDKDDFNISSDKIQILIDAFNDKSVSRHPLPEIALHEDLKLKGIIAVDLFGCPANYYEINKIAKKNNLVVIEDAAQSFGATQNGNKTCSLADIACTSFFPAKPLGCYGDGGAIFCNDDNIADTLRSIRVHGQGVNKYENIRLGLTGRLDTIQAAVLSVKLEIFDNEINERQRVAKYYKELINKNKFKVQKIKSENESVWAQFTLVANTEQERDDIVKKLNENEISTSIYYPIPLHMQKAYQSLGYHSADFEITLDLSKKVFSIPMHPYLKEREIERICKVINDE
ncbi:DegT/DnrJ/EryC1/StrS family aminotransferase [Zooshikella marina]|uniref:DegT/DnrJ/EryC1/StrS family aminotransferase n=1 Tax=Zooshikella ganghwensis TaxID=202772 RepID=UPI001BAF6957|nr:DegT/DnrJ/EryC1/StrS family aminotransferase [Zooshikella ganghwensis]MBU2704621.1 DegT/DnrJ/EryC1/StrS family aminotransferase [Zooshikella ganghwensis]